MNRLGVACLLTFAATAFGVAGSLSAAEPATTRPANAAVTDKSPSAIISETTDKLFGALVSRRAEFQKNPAALQAFARAELDEGFDHDYSARLVLGRHGRTLDDAKIHEFADALTDGLLHRYSTSLLDIEPSNDVRIVGESPMRDGAIIRVRTEIGRRAGPPVPVDYMFHKDPAGAWKAFDVIVEGVSYIQTYRAQFDQQLKTKTIDQVIAALRAGAIVPADS